MARNLRRHLPFAAFASALGLLTLWLQFNAASYTFSLPSLHVFFQILLGVTAVAILRNLVGVKTYGTFGAVIVAVSMLASGALLGFLIFAGMLGAVVLVRAALARESVQEAHRVAILVIIVALAAVGSAMAGLLTHLPALAYAAVFPVLITAWIAERFVEDVSRIGWYKPLFFLSLTVASIVVAYVVMAQSSLVTFVSRNPLSWTGLVLLNWFLGTRVRVRFSERFRFRGNAADDDTSLGDTVLTMNRRNREFVDKYNAKGLLASLDKARIKTLLVPSGIPMPRSYLVVRGRRDLPQAAALLERLPTVAIKPASSFGGEGIVLVRGRRGPEYLVNGHVETREGLLRHIERIVNGDFNDGIADAAILEELVQQDPSLRPIAPEGVADIRVLTFLGYPVMAMARLPTRRSRGRANLHAGAVGAGIDLATGRLTNAVWNGTPVAVHPDTAVALRGYQIPRWKEILEIASAAQEASGLGFTGVDIVLDASHGPVVLEVNRRPGLEIQNANRQGLLPRLRAIEARSPSPLPPERRVEIALRLSSEGWSAPSVSSYVPGPLWGPFPPAKGP